MENGSIPINMKTTKKSYYRLICVDLTYIYMNIFYVHA